MTYQSQGQPQPQESKTSPGKIIAIILLAFVGVALVLVVGVLIGRALAPPSQASGNNPPNVAPPTAAPSEPYLAANTAVNVRAGPGTNYAVYGVMSPGQAAAVEGKSPDGAWWVIRIPTSIAPDGKGWISAAYTSAYNSGNVPVIEPPPPPPDINPPPPEGGSDTGVTTDVINVRAGPGNQFDSYGKIPKGITVQITGQEGNWLSIVIPTSVSPDGVGWASASYVDQAP